MDVELPLHLDRGGGVPLWRQVAAGLRDAVDSGTLVAGQRVPSSRALARTLGTSRIVVATGYDQLLAEGYLTARHGSGTFVADVHPPAARRPRARGRPAPSRPALRVTFGLAVHGPSASGERTWRRALAAAARSAPLSGDDPRGARQVRTAVAGYLRRSRGLPRDPDGVLLTSGTTTALSEVARQLLAGRPVAVEDPGYPRGRSALEAGGARAVAVPADDGGLVVGDLPQGVAAVLCSPSHQFPLGGRMLLERRRALLDAADRTGFLVLEDDYDSEFRYDTGPLPALASMAPDRVLYLGTTSQVLGHGTGLGWLVGPPHLVQRLAEHTPSHVRAHPLLAHAFGAWLASGEAEREVRRARRRHAATRAALVAALSRHGLTVRGDDAGLHLLVDLPPGWTSTAAVEALAARGVSVTALDAYGTASRPALVLGYGSATPETIQPDAELLASVLATRPAEPRS